MTNEYKVIFAEHLRKYFELANQKVAIQAQITKIQQMLRASYNMLSDEEKQPFAESWEAVWAMADDSEQGLTESIRTILRSNQGEWFNARNIRERLEEKGFDFSAYISNPLISIHSVLKRFEHATEVRTRRSQGPGFDYQWIKPGGKSVKKR